MTTFTPARDWRSSPLLAMAILLMGTCAAVMVSAHLRDEAAADAQAEFQRSVERVAQEATRRFETPLTVLRGVRGLLMVNPRLSQADFAGYVQGRGIAQDAPGVRGIGLIERVPRQQLDSFVAAQRAGGRPQFTLRRLGPGDDDPLHIVRFIEPAANNHGVAGLDVGSEPHRRQALLQAVDSGAPAITAAITLVQDERSSPGVLMVLPVYRAGAPQSTPEERRRALLAVACAPIVLADLLQGLPDVASGRVGVALFDASGTTPPETAIFASGPPGTQAGRHEATQPLVLPGRTLTLRVHSTPAFDAGFDDPTPALALVGGLLCSGLLAGMQQQQASGRRRAERRARALTADLHRLAMVAQHTSNAVIISDRALTITWVNDGFTRIYGYSADEALGRTPADLLGSSHHQPEALATLRQATETGIGCRVQLVNRRRDGREVWIETEVQPALDADGQVVGFVEIANDITEARQAAQALAAERQRLANIIDGTRAGTWEHRLDSRQDVINGIYAQMLGYTLPECEALITPSFLSLVHPDDVAALAQARDAHLAGASLDYEVEFRMRHKDGRWVWIQARGMVSERDASGRPLVIAGIHIDISARKQAERELARGRQRLANIIDGTHVGTWEWNVETGETVFNARWAQIVGHTLDELGPTTIETWSRFVHPDDLSRSAVLLERHFNGETPGYECEARMRHKDGHWVWVLDRGKLFSRSDDGRPRWMAGTHMDITQRKAAESALRASQDLLDRTGRIGGVGGWEIDLTTNELRWTDQTCRIHDLEPGHQPTLEQALACISADSRPRLRRAVAAAMATGGGWDLELSLQTASGRTIWVHGVGQVEMQDGRPLRMVGAIQDITARRALEDELRRNHELLRGAIDTIDEAFVLFDPDDRLVYCNEKYRRLYAVSVDAIVPGARFEDMLRTGAQRGQYVAAEGRVEAWGEERMAIHRAGATALVQQLADGRTVRIVERRMPDGHTVGFRTDITELVRTTQAAEAASRAKSQFLANMSHEIRTPMNAVLGMLSLLRRTPLSPRQADYAAKTEGAARSLLGLLDDILDFSKVEAGKMTLDPQPFAVEQLLRDLAVILSANAGAKPLELLFDVDPALPRHLVGDAMRLQQVLINLAGNAIKFTPQGEVVLSVAVHARDAQTVTVGFAVRDTGIGIAPEHHAHIFGGFSQAESSTTRRFGGTGLGLAISSRLVAMMGGQLQLDSAPGQGSCFRFVLVLPLADAPAVPLAAPPHALHVLFVDDHPAARDALVRMAGGLGWTADTADSGDAALERLRAGTGYQAVFIDWQMPGLDGWQTSQRVRDLGLAGAAPLVLMVSASDREVLAQRSQQDPALLAGCLVKPVIASMLQEAVTGATAAVTDFSSVAAPGPGRLAGLRVLVAEDNVINQQVARELLEDEGATVHIAADGREAVAAVAAASPGFDAVLMDLQMPLMDGVAATACIRRDLGQHALPVVAMTANAMASDREACLAAGMDEHIGKPFDLDHLVGVLRRLTGRARVAPAAAAHAAALAVPGPAGAAAQAARVDLDTALARLGGKTEVYRAMLRRFVDELQALPAALQADAAAGAPDALARRLHTLRGVAATLGAGALAAAAAHAERTLAAAPAQAGAVARSLLADTTAAAPALAALCLALDGAATPAPAPAVEAAALQAGLVDLAELLRNADMAALDALAALAPGAAAALGEPYAALDRAVGALDFELALRQCRHLIETLAA